MEIPIVELVYGPESGYCKPAEVTVVPRESHSANDGEFGCGESRSVASVKDADKFGRFLWQTECEEL